MFLDFKQFKGRRLTENEQLESIIRDLKFANRLGCKVMRVIVSTTPELMRRAAPHAEDLDVKIGIEIHSPWHINNAWMSRHLEVMEQTGSTHLGFIPDMGIFSKKLPKIAIDRMVRNGVSQEVADVVSRQYEAGIFNEYIVAEAYGMTNKPMDRALGEMVRFYNYVNPKSLLPYMSRIFHVHAKFYDMTADYNETTIPYPEVIKVFQEGGFNGYFSSEYEGNRHIQDVFEVDSVEQVRRQQEMFKKLFV